MLETLDLSLKLGKDEYRSAMDKLGLDLQMLQRAAFEHGVPMLVVFEGWDSAGKGDSIANLLGHMDPRGFKVHVTRQPSEEEAYRPMLWRFWNRIPGKGAIAIFDRSWYGLLLDQRVDGTLDHRGWEQELVEAAAFERQLADDGMVILKFWLQIEKKEQKKRLKAWENDKAQRWRASQDIWAKHRRYDMILQHVEVMLARSHTHRAPWTLVEAKDQRFRRVKVLGTVASALRRALESRGVALPTGEEPPAKTPHRTKATAFVHKDPLLKPPVIPADSPLSRVDLGLALEREDYNKQVAEAQQRLRECHFLSYARRHSAVIMFEGWDAAGKGGTIKRLTENLDPRGYSVIPIAAPTRVEASCHYLWRFWQQIPKDGHMAIFDRSWYGRVIVERIEGFCTEEQWRRAYQEINEFERTLADHGAVICKFWLHISPEEQLARFRRRESIASKNYKITDEDWRNRAKWPQYLEAVSDMLRQTSTPHAPWTIVEANDKLWARVKVLNTVLRSMQEAARV